MLKSLTVWITQQAVENSSRDRNTRPPGLLRNQDVGQEATVRTGHGTTYWFQIGKGVLYIFKAVYCHPAYLIHMQSTS